jgi:hypothetical protein
MVAFRQAVLERQNGQVKGVWPTHRAGARPGDASPARFSTEKRLGCAEPRRFSAPQR